MKQNGTQKIIACNECQDCEYNLARWKCRKFKMENEYKERLFEQCLLPEIREIKVWLEKRPEGADILDIIVNCFPATHTKWGLIPPSWTISVKISDTEWTTIASFPDKENAEKYIGCKIPQKEVDDGN